MINGSGNGKNIYIVTVNNPNNSPPQFMESETNGKTWIHSKNLPVSQYSIPISFIYIKETARLYISFYEEDKPMFLITKSQNSMIFSNPLIISESDSWPYLTYTLNNNKPILHVFYIDKNKGNKLYYMQSVNNGIAWTDPKCLWVSAVTQDLTIISNPQLTKAFFVFFRLNFSGDRDMIYSMNNGETFSHTFYLANYYSELPEVQICGTQSNKIIAIISNTGDYTLIKNWEINEPISERIMHPFVKGNKKQIISCNSQISASIYMVGYLEPNSYAISTNEII